MYMCMWKAVDTAQVSGDSMGDGCGVVTKIAGPGPQVLWIPAVSTASCILLCVSGGWGGHQQNQKESGEVAGNGDDDVGYQ